MKRRNGRFGRGQRSTRPGSADRMVADGLKEYSSLGGVIRMVWQSADDDIADESERDVLDLIKILAIRL